MAAICALISAAVAVPAVDAADFSAVDVQSRVGELLYAEVLVSPASGERLDLRCLRVADSLEASLPVLRQVSLRLIDAAPGDERKLLRLESRRAILDTAIAVLIDVDCGAGKARHELTLPLPGASRPGAGEPAASATSARNSPDRAARPSRSAGGEAAAVATLRAPASSRPALVISAAPADERLPLRAQVTPLPRREIEPRLRMSEQIGVAPAVNDTLREALRLEYRLLVALNEQLYAHSAAALQGPSSGSGATAADSPATVREPAVAASPQLPGAEAAREASGAAVAPPPVPAPESPVSTSTVNPPSPAGSQAIPPSDVASEARARSLPKSPPVAENTGGDDWLLPLGGLAAAIVLLGVVIVRRRRQPLPDVPPSPEFAETVMLTHDLPSPPLPAAADAGDEAVIGAAHAVPGRHFAPPEAAASAEPVMELAEIMLSFGRLQGAAQTLQEYIDAHPGEDLHPWVRLLDIYRSAEMRREFEDLSRRFNNKFNVEVQHWEAPPPPVEDAEIPPKAETIEDIPHIREQLLQLWGTPACIDYLRRLLHDNRGGQRSGFRLPVVQEILLLLDVAEVREA